MNKKYFAFLSFFAVLVLIASCAPAQQAPVPKLEAKTEVKQTVQGQTTTAQKQEIPADVLELLNKHKTKVSSIYYKYRGPETGNDFYEFYVRGSKIKYKPSLETKSLDKPDSYDAIFIDKTAKTAQSYCLATYCAYKGKKADLSYATAYISTVFDWIDVTSAEKVGEEVIDSRSTWKLETNKGIIWMDTFYGIPLKAESGGKTYRFEQISINNVQDSDVIPS